MRAADVAPALFALCHNIEVFAWFTQIVSIARDQKGAASVSCTTR